jgi:hypothetical protein
MFNRIAAVYKELKLEMPLAIENLKSHLTNFGQCAVDGFCAQYGATDFFYVPSRLRLNMIKILKSFRKYNVHFEVAFPTALKMLDSTSQHQSFGLQMYYWPGVVTNDQVINKWTPNTYVMIHPIKLSKPDRSFQNRFCNYSNSRLGKIMNV